jgi:OOP family OmpA-OmpF porin
MRRRSLNPAQIPIRRCLVSARLAPRFALALLVLACATVTALAGPPATLDHVDPKAPCFRWPAVDLDRDGVFDRIDRCDNTPQGAIVDEWGCPLDSDGDGVYDGLDKCPGTPPGEKVDKNGCSRVQLSGSTRAPDQEAKAATPVTPPPAPAPPASETERQLVEGGRIRLENVYFETGSARLLPESETTLNELGQVLEKFVDLRVEIQGHTDTRGSRAFNQGLSQSRAESVRSYLLSRFRLRDANLVAKGYGESQPETQERNDEERLRNRRVEIKALNPEVLPGNVKVEQRN